MVAESLYDYEKRYTVAAVFRRRYILRSGGFNWSSLFRDIVLAAVVVCITLLAGLTRFVSPLEASLLAAAACWFFTVIYIHYYYVGIERLLLQLPGVTEETRVRITVAARLLAFCLFFFLISAAMHALAAAHITILLAETPGVPLDELYYRMPFLGILSITYLSLMFGLASFSTRLKPATRSKQAAKLLLLAVLFTACSSLGGYLLGSEQMIYIMLVVLFMPLTYSLVMLCLLSIVSRANKRAVLNARGVAKPT